MPLNPVLEYNAPDVQRELIGFREQLKSAMQLHFGYAGIDEASVLAQNVKVYKSDLETATTPEAVAQAHKMYLYRERVIHERAFIEAYSKVPHEELIDRKAFADLANLLATMAIFEEITRYIEAVPEKDDGTNYKAVCQTAERLTKTALATLHKLYVTDSEMYTCYRNIANAIPHAVKQMAEKFDIRDVDKIDQWLTELNRRVRSMVTTFGETNTGMDYKIQESVDNEC